MRCPDYQRMVRARAEVDAHLNQLLVLLTAAPGSPISNVEVADPLIAQALRAARSALNDFEEACHA